jgi:Zn-dependent M28 family amino/carboxypeptidase
LPNSTLRDRIEAGLYAARGCLMPFADAMESSPMRLAFACLIALLEFGSAAAHEIDPQRLSRIARTLASDQFEGRAPSTPGEARTIAYLVEQFRALGLEPGGSDGGWTQTVKLVHTQIGAPAALQMTAGATTRALMQGEDATFLTVRPVERVQIEQAGLVFVGYGVTAPERGWDDFKGIDLHGKIAIFLVNDPDFEAGPDEPVAGKFGGKAMTYYGRWTYKFEEAARRGAVGALIVHETPGAGYGWSTVIAANGEAYDVVRPATAVPPVLLQGWLKRDVAVELFRAAGLDLEQLKRAARRADFTPVTLAGASLSADLAVTAEAVESHNVLAKITGAAHPDESVMFGAHWDAYGIGPRDANGDRIRRGANDDALGIAGVLEIARAFKSGPRPLRTVVFAAWTGEERGLLGSETYAMNPLQALDRTVANFTIDILQTAGPSRDVVLIGAGQNSLADDLAREAARQKRRVTPDAHPERGLFYRADHFPLAKRGVPVLLMMAIGGGPDLIRGGRAAGERWVDDYTQRCYHKPCDAWSADWDLRGAAQDVALLYAVGRDLANSRRWPSWNPGTEFKQLRDQSAERRN